MEAQSESQVSREYRALKFSIFKFSKQKSFIRKKGA